MSLLDDDFVDKVDVNESLSVKLLELMCNDELSMKHTLYHEMWRIWSTLKEVNVITELDENIDISEPLLIGYDYLYLPNIFRLQVKFFDPKRLIFHESGSYYKDFNGDQLKYSFDKNNCYGKISKYRLITSTLPAPNTAIAMRCYGDLLIKIEDIFKGFISDKQYLVLPTTGLEEYIVASERYTDQNYCGSLGKIINMQGEIISEYEFTR